jgi:peptidylprolyl isomerase
MSDLTRRMTLALAFGATILAAPIQALAGPKMVIEVAGQASGEIVINLSDFAAPNHVERIVRLAREGAYDNVVFHRVIPGFMAQTGDVQFGRRDGDLSRVGTGGSDLPDLREEFSHIPFEAGTVGMARSQDPNSANSQFFLMFGDAPYLNGQYTVVGQVISGMDVVNAIKKGDPARNGAVTDPDYMARVRIEP